MAYNKEGKVYASSLKATTEWRKSHTKKFFTEFNIDSDAEVIAKIMSVPNKTDYIRQLVLADIANERKEG